MPGTPPPPSPRASSGASLGAAGASPEALGEALEAAGHLADPAVVLSLWLALGLERPLMVEGPAGVGKTDLARAASVALGRPLVRLQCYEGLDESKALYEWDYAKQMLVAQLLREASRRETAGAATLAEGMRLVAESEASFFSERFLVARPLLAAVRSASPVVLLVDEVDRADPEFEALLLEVLSDLQVTVPELGTFRASHPPLVVLTTNATREMTEALRRRCLHAFVDYPPPSRELAILRRAVPGLEARLAASLVDFVGRLRDLELRKSPAISETLDYARALVLMGRGALDPALAASTLGLLLKHQEDRLKVEAMLPSLLEPGDRDG